MDKDNKILSPTNGAPKPNVPRFNTFSDHGNEVTDIISNKPPFWVRWGTMYFFCFLIIIALASWFIKYPDKIGARGVLNSVNAPKEVVALSGGKLIKLFVRENDRVIKQQVLGFLESTADHNEVIRLSTLLDSANEKNLYKNEIDISIFHSPFTRLGEMQSAYQVFYQACITYSNYLHNGFYQRKRMMLQNDMNNLFQLHATLLNQKSLLEQDLSLSDTTFNANEVLRDEKVISAMEYRNEKSKRIAKQMSIPQINASIINNEGQQNEKKKEIAELENEIQQQKDIFNQALHTLASQVDEWKRKYLLIAPVDGVISFSSFIQENQQLKQGQTVCYINPGNTNYYAEALISQYNFGKVKTGQQVLLKFPAYPYQEFGSVNGMIEFISSTPSDSGYMAKISLPAGLITNYKKLLRYKTGLSLQAEIITENMNLLQRLFYDLRKKTVQ